MMPASPVKKSTHKTKSDNSHLRVVKATPNDRSIYFKNHGLFADNYLINRLPSETSDSFLLQNWDTEALPEFSACYEWMLGTWEQEKDILPTLSEAQLEEKWIRPILERLGWTFDVQVAFQRQGRTQIPDYSLFASNEQYRRSKNAQTPEAYFANVTAVADAKAMGVPLDGVKRSNANPSYQIVRYMEDTEKNWGILTDGEYWRLYSKKAKSKFTTFYEVNIRRLLAGRNGAARDDEGFKYFFNFFRKDAFVNQNAAGSSFLDVVYESGEQYAQEVETELKSRAFKIVEGMVRGFCRNKQQGLSAEFLREAYQHSLYYLFRLMFILNCESKGILDVNDFKDYFPHSLKALIDRLKGEFERGMRWPDIPRTYRQLEDLFLLLAKGDKAIQVQAFGSEAFSSGRPEFFSENSIPDSILNKAILDLGCTYNQGGDLQFIDYARLGPDHLGSLFEGLLEYQVKVADKNYCVDKKGRVVEEDDLKGPAIERIEKGQIYLTNDSGERKDTGSFYTPDYMVDFMVAHTLQPVCSGLSTDKLLKLRVCDPAMGSGHFLLGAAKYLEERIRENLFESDSGKECEIDPLDIRRQVVENCLYGVDLNPLAVELAKFSLWIYSAKRGALLEPLDDQLKIGDSLIGDREVSASAFDWKSEFRDILGRSGFDAIVGNPPYVARKNSEYVGTTGTFAGQGDLYLAFLDQILDGSIPLSETGRFSLIVPDPVLIRNNARAIREKILRSHRLVHCLHINGVFEAGVSNAVLTIQRNNASSAHEIEFYRIDNITLLKEFEKTSKIPAQAFKNVVPVTAFTSTPDFALTYLIESRDNPKFDLLLSGGASLSEFFVDSRGEETSKSEIRANSDRSGRLMMVGGEAIKPYRIVDEAIVRVKPAFVKKRSDLYKSPKIVLQKSAPKFIAAVDSGQRDQKGIVVPQSIYILHSREEDSVVDVWFGAALLNSELANSYLFKCITGYKLVQPHFEQKDIKSFPMFNVSGFDKTKVKSERVKIAAALRKSESEVPEYGLSKEALIAAASALSEHLHTLAIIDESGTVARMFTAEIEKIILRLYKVCNVSRAAA